MKIWTRQRQLLRLVGVVAAVAVAVSEAGVGAGLGMLPAQAQAEGAGAGARVPMPLPVRLNQPHRLTRRAAALRRARRRAAVSCKSWCMLPAWLRSALLSLTQVLMSVVTIHNHNTRHPCLFALSVVTILVTHDGCKLQSLLPPSQPRTSDGQIIDRFAKEKSSAEFYI